jgi:Methyltransferase domain
MRMKMKKLFTFLACYFYAMVSGIFLFSLGILWGKNRTFLYQMATYFWPLEWVPGKPKARIPTIALAEILPGQWDITVLEAAALDGHVSSFELMILNQLVRRYRPKNLFEIGTFDGRTTLNLAANCLENGRVFTLDLPMENQRHTQLPLEKSDIAYINKEASGQRLLGTAYTSKVSQLFGDSASFDYAPYLGRMDFVFVDGSHSYEYVLNDTRRALSLLREKKGIVLWHDYGSWPGVTKCLDRLYETEKDFASLRRIEGTFLACWISTVMRPMNNEPMNAIIRHPTYQLSKVAKSVMSGSAPHP